MKIAILGTRGIPNNYGGFERCAEEVAVRLQRAGHEVVVYVPEEHPYREPFFQGVRLVRIQSYPRLTKTFSVFLYDLASLRSVERERPHVVLELGYNPSSIFFPKKRDYVLVTNMDGLEWKRSKWNRLVRIFSKLCERLAVERSDVLIADNVGIQEYLKKEYDASSTFIAYGSSLDNVFAARAPNWIPSEYHLIVARIESENNIENIIRGYVLSGSVIPLVVVGKVDHKYAIRLARHYGSAKVRFVGGIYDTPLLNLVRAKAKLYFHGHSVGGTNPSLLEAMSLGCRIVAHDNPFNKNVLGNGALYFESPENLALLIQRHENDPFSEKVVANRQVVQERYTWEKISKEYESLCINTQRPRP